MASLKLLPLLILSFFIISSCKEYEVRSTSSSKGIEPSVYTLLQSRCFECHAGGANEGDFGVIDDLEAMVAGGYLVKGSPSDSLLYEKITSPSYGKKMPYGGPYLSDSEVATIRTWISSMVASDSTPTPTPEPEPQPEPEPEDPVDPVAALDLSCKTRVYVANVSFQNDIKPIFEQSLMLAGNEDAQAYSSSSCLRCHRVGGGGGGSSKVYLSDATAALEDVVENGGAGDGIPDGRQYLSYTKLQTCTSSLGATTCAPFNGILDPVGNPTGTICDSIAAQALGISCGTFDGKLIVPGSPCSSRLYRRVSEHSGQSANYVTNTRMGLWNDGVSDQTYSPIYAPTPEATWSRMPKSIGVAGSDDTTGATRRVFTDAELAKIYSWILDGALNN